MKMMEKVAKYHELVSHAQSDILEAEKSYELVRNAYADIPQAERSKVQRNLDNARDEYRYLMEAVRLEGECFCSMFRLYSEMKEDGNTMLNISDDYSDPENIMKLFKVCGITRFTYSSRWSDALKSAYVFENSGYHIDGMTEVNGGARNNNKKLPALVFEMR